LHLQFITNIELALNFEGLSLAIINTGATSFHTRMKTEAGTKKSIPYG
jgi:hypothetical protein